MQDHLRSRSYGLLCAGALLICVLISHPAAEIGINDEWSYIRSAKILADTGHVGYVGWASAMLGWMLPLAVLFIKLFGFSFTVVRASNVFTAVVNTFVMQRCMARSGLNDWNSVVATLALVLSPLYLPLSTSFMTDVAGLTVITICFYCCIRAVQAGTREAAFGWLLTALVISDVGGTARQTSWLCAMVMVPTTTYLVRLPRSRNIILGVCWLLSLGLVYGCLHWFNRQPYALGEAVIGNYIDRDLLFGFVKNIVRAPLALCFFLLPIVVAFVPKMSFADKRVRKVTVYAGVVIVLVAVFVLATHQLSDWLAPFGENTLTAKGFMDVREIGVLRPMLSVGVRVVLTLAVLIAGTATVAFCFSLTSRRLVAETRLEAARPTWRDLGIVVGPFLAVYTVLVLHRGLFASIYDRYLLPIMFVTTLVLVRLYQERIGARLPKISLAVLALAAMFAVAANHDLFARERAVVQAAQELNDAGVPRDQFYGGWEYDGWTQVDHYGFVNSGYMNMPYGFSANAPIETHPELAPCDYHRSRLYPAIHPRYALSFDDVACDGPAPFAPVAWHSWLPPYGGEVFVRSARTHTKPGVSRE